MRQTRALLEKAAAAALPEWASLAATGRLCTFQRGDAVFVQGQWQPYVYVVCQGLVKLSYFNEDGDEWIKSVIGEGDFFACPNVLVAGLPTDYAAIAVEDCQIERVDFAGINGLMARYPLWQHAIRQLLEWHIVRKEQRERELLTLTPEQRYQAFLRDHPTWAERLQVRDVAHFLGITPEALSRIRKRLRP